MPFNAAEWLVDRWCGPGGRSDAMAYLCQDRTVTYGELQSLSYGAAHALADLGVRPGSRFVMVVQDDETFPAFFLGGLRMGAIPIPVSTMIRPSEVSAIASDSGAVAVVASPPFSAHASACGVSSLAASLSVLADQRPVSLFSSSSDMPAFWLYTSGTTGQSKGAIHCHGDIKVVCDTYASTVLGITAEDTCYSIAKLFFAFGLGNALFFPLSVGARAVLDPAPPTPLGAAALLSAHRPTLFFAPPGFCAAMADAPDLPSDSLASVRYTVTAGESLPPEVMRRFTSRFGTTMLDGIGSTEALHIFCSNHPSDVRPGMSGRPVSGYELELRTADGSVVTDSDEPGFLWVRGDSVASGYWQRPDETAANFVDGWLRTGDVYTRSPDGYWRFVGRNSDMIKPGGIWVSPAEVESVLLEHEDVLEAAVVGGRSADGLEVVVAFVVPRSGRVVDVAGVDAHCRERMAAFKRPRQIRVVEALPKTATGKIRRFALRESLGG